jgi:hypothetical protein
LKKKINLKNTYLRKNDIVLKRKKEKKRSGNEGNQLGEMDSLHASRGVSVASKMDPRARPELRARQGAGWPARQRSRASSEVVDEGDAAGGAKTCLPAKWLFAAMLGVAWWGVICGEMDFRQGGLVAGETSLAGSCAARWAGRDFTGETWVL